MKRCKKYESFSMQLGFPLGIITELISWLLGL